MEVQILTKDNQATILKTLESIRECNPRNVIVGDMGSSDKTVEICKNWGAEVYSLGRLKRNEARNRLSQKSGIGWKMMIEPWEVVVQGHDSISSQDGRFAYASIIQDGILSKEIRFWKDGHFINPIFERINGSTSQESQTILFSNGGYDPEYANQCLNEWKAENSFHPSPYYYLAYIALSQNKISEFFNLSDHYMLLEKNKTCMSATMSRYYYAMATLIHKKQVKTTLQNINLCMCVKPLMPEFWCLTGDVFYHLLDDYENACCFYENALFLGSHRLQSDKWPMTISKYKEYPEKMIRNCKDILANTSNWATG